MKCLLRQDAISWHAKELNNFVQNMELCVDKSCEAVFSVQNGEQCLKSPRL